MREKEDFWKDRTLNIWEKWLGKKAKNYNFEKMRSKLYQVSNFEEQKNLPHRTGIYLGIYLNERNLEEKITDWERDKNGNNQN